MTLTKQHFIAIAEILKKNKADFNLINDFCIYFQNENPNFDEHKFRKAIVEEY